MNMHTVYVGSNKSMIPAQPQNTGDTEAATEKRYHSHCVYRACARCDNRQHFTPRHTCGRTDPHWYSPTLSAPEVTLPFVLLLPFHHTTLQTWDRSFCACVCVSLKAYAGLAKNSFFYCNSSQRFVGMTRSGKRTRLTEGALRRHDSFADGDEARKVKKTSQIAGFVGMVCELCSAECLADCSNWSETIKKNNKTVPIGQHCLTCVNFSAASGLSMNVLIGMKRRKTDTKALVADLEQFSENCQGHQRAPIRTRRSRRGDGVPLVFTRVVRVPNPT